jgi:iron complex outermembrane receptor protein
MKKILFLAIGMALSLSAFAQSVSGKVMHENGDPVIGATVIEDGTTNGAFTDANGEFSMTMKTIPGKLIVSYLGHTTQVLSIENEAFNLSVTLAELSSKLDEIVIVGSRGKPRTIIGSAVPIDNINADDLISSGQPTVDQMINYKVPSYNSSNQTISDATAHFDPSELRNLGPSRTLVLVNGKRKNQSSLVYVNDTPGKGEVGVDMKSIPASAIERIEVLRDGASAQYGSDAIAGVINIILKERPNSGEVNVSSGITAEGDGMMTSADLNLGNQIGQNGYLNFTASYYHQDETNRAGEPGQDDLFGVGATNPWIQDNPDLGMTIGQPEYDRYAANVNFGLPYNGTSGELYVFGSGAIRQGKSFALYRAPYWVTEDHGLLTPEGEDYNGFQPTFETDISDYSFTVGNSNVIRGWNTDVSFTTGSNSVGYTIGNTINVDLGAASPIEFDAGAYKFGHNVVNVDMTRIFGEVELSLGSEWRQETFEVEAGQEESYIGGGAQSFPGLQPGNALEEDRTNIGVYAGLDWDVSEAFLISGAVRYEDYSDFGENLSWKLAARHNLGKKGAIRASVSTGFRAPSLHQIYLSNIQTLVSGGTVSNQGTFNNVSEVIQGLGIEALDAETSFNISAGITYKLTDNLTISADYYNVTLNDRVLFSGEIGSDGDTSTVNPVEQVLEDYDVTSIKFFINALDTKTSGVDVVVDYDNIDLGFGDLGLVFAFNYNKTEIDGQPNAPDVLVANGYEDNFFNRKEQARVTTARPDIKFTLGANLGFGDFKVALNNTYFGEVTWQHASDPAKDQTFAAKVITDLLVGYEFNDKWSVGLTINNLLDVYPDEIDTKGDYVTDLGGRFRYPWEVNQFGFNGMMMKFGVKHSF